jgi:hypothetical protein
LHPLLYRWCCEASRIQWQQTCQGHAWNSSLVNRALRLTSKSPDKSICFVSITETSAPPNHHSYLSLVLLCFALDIGK